VIHLCLASYRATSTLPTWLMVVLTRQMACATSSRPVLVAFGSASGQSNDDEEGDSMRSGRKWVCLRLPQVDSVSMIVRVSSGRAAGGYQ
jgi:hypothetical protein